MQSSYIATLDNLQFPRHSIHNLSDICQSAFDRFYQVYVARLVNSGYQFPPVARYSEQFGGHRLPASCIVTKSGGFFFDPGVVNRCLVFLSDGHEPVVRVYIARGVVYKSAGLDLFGEGAGVLPVRLRGDATAVVVAVPTDALDGLTSEGVTRL